MFLLLKTSYKVIMEWIFDGIGTEILSFLMGTGLGIAGCRLYYKNKQIQKAGEDAVQIQIGGNNKGNIVADRFSGDKISPSGDYISGNKIISDSANEFDVCNLSNYTAAQIENVIAKGNNETRRKWCLELIINQRQEYLIMKCIDQMEDNEEKCKLLEELSERNFEDSKYFIYIFKSLSNAVYQTKAIELCISKNLKEYIEFIFDLIENNRYIYISLTKIYEFDEDLFKRLYDNGNCFDNENYKEKMRKFLSEIG